MTAQIVEIAGQKIAMLPIEDYQRLIDIVGDRAGITAAYLSDLERGNTEGSIGTWLKLAEALEVSLNDIAPEN